jgi:hypothetical protein
MIIRAVSTDWLACSDVVIAIVGLVGFAVLVWACCLIGITVR